jgi:hypothetical protein
MSVLGNRRWTEADDQIIAALVAKKLTAREIAMKFRDARVTRNAVISRAHRMKIALNPPVVKPEKRQRLSTCESFHSDQPAQKQKTAHGGKRVARMKPQYKPLRDVSEPVVPPPVKSISLLHVGNHQCRWPLDGRGADGLPRCCGEVRERGLSYCAEHSARAYGCRGVGSTQKNGGV